MGITRYQGPLIVPGALSSPPGGDYNDTPGPSGFAHGWGLIDQRFFPQGGGDVTNILPMHYCGGEICVVNATPATLSATNISAAAVPVAGTPLTLAAASTGITVLAAAFSLMPGMGPVPTGALVMDSNPALVQLGTLGGGISMYDPRTMVTRCLRFTSVGDDHLATAAVVGYDWYGNIVHETVTLANAGIATSKKALKFIVSITPAGTLSGSNLSVGTSDVYGFQLAAYDFGSASIFWNSAAITASTGFTAAVTTSPATATTGDVRGTYGVQSASDGTKTLQMYVNPQAWNCTQAKLWGVTQF